LRLDGHQVDHAQTIRAAQIFLREHTYGLIVLDRMLPDGHGADLCQRLRADRCHTPVLMLTALGSVQQRVEGLDAGADDYLPKPFELAELRARISALLRRQIWTSQQSTLLRFGAVEVDFDAHTVLVNSVPVKLTSLELSLLRYFADNTGRVLTRGELLEQVWHLDPNTKTRAVDNFIARLRRQLEPEPNRPIYFRSIRGAGYQFVIG